MKAPRTGPAIVPGPPMMQAAIGMIEKSTANNDNPSKARKVSNKGASKTPDCTGDIKSIDLYSGDVNP